VRKCVYRSIFWSAPAGGQWSALPPPPSESHPRLLCPLCRRLSGLQSWSELHGEVKMLVLTGTATPLYRPPRSQPIQTRPSRLIDSYHITTNFQSRAKSVKLRYIEVCVQYHAIT
jgi:hypothetical protein